jgi:hypothetical protein
MMLMQAESKCEIEWDLFLKYLKFIWNASRNKKCFMSGASRRVRPSRSDSKITQNRQILKLILFSLFLFFFFACFFLMILLFHSPTVSSQNKQASLGKTLLFLNCIQNVTGKIPLLFQLCLNMWGDRFAF